MTEEIGVGRWVRKGYCLSPNLFSIYLEETLKVFFYEKSGVYLVERKIKCIRFAADI